MMQNDEVFWKIHVYLLECLETTTRIFVGSDWLDCPRFYCLFVHLFRGNDYQPTSPVLIASDCANVAACFK